MIKTRMAGWRVPCKGCCMPVTSRLSVAVSLCSMACTACRLTCPWGALADWCFSFDLQQLDNHTFQHLPYGKLTA
jgi:hypothetical protein